MSSSTPGQTSFGSMAPNLGGLLCYVPCCIGFIFSVIVAIVEKQSRFLKFHAFQSLLVHAAQFVIWLAITIVQFALGFVSGALAAMLGFASLLLVPVFLILHIFLMIKANGNEEYMLPVIGEMSRKWASGS